MTIARKSAAFALVLGLVLAFVLLAVDRYAGAANDPITDPGLASGDGVTPVLIQDNPTCSSLGNYRELKVDPPNNGTYTSADGYLTATISNIRDEGLGQIFNWSSTRGVDKVIVKGGDAADAYVYTPEDTADTRLHAPVNPNTEKYYDLSHMSFCYDVKPQVSKTANTTFTRTFGWTIDKSVTPTELNLVTGDSGAANYTVAVTKDNGTDSDWAVSGTITVTNPLNNGPLNISAIEDVVSQGATNTTANVANCTSNNNSISFPYSLAANASLACSYSTGLGSGTNGTNTATAKASGTGITDGVGTANVTFGSPTEMVNDSITVNDNFAGSGSPWTFGASGSKQYPRTIGPFSTCGDQTVVNTASISPASAASGPSSDSATVTAHVKCKLTVLKKLDPATDAGKFNLLIDGTVKAANVGDGGTTGAQQVALGSHTVSETAGDGTSLPEYVSKINCGNGDVNGTSTTVSFQSGDSDKSCTITNTKKGQVTVKKTTDGVVNPNRSINFTLYDGSSPQSSVITTLNTSGDQDGVLQFGYTLVPGQLYTVCENPVPAGFTSKWTLVGQGIVTPFNPNATDTPSQDLGVRCYTFSANAGQKLAFEVDNSHPGGEPRTIGYWRNWNKCTNGNQAATAAKNGGAAAGVFIVEDLLPQTVGNFNVTTCAQAVKVLSKQDQSGTNRASDAAYELAAQLLAAKFNLAAGAETCTVVQNAVVNGQQLLVSINFTGTGAYLTKASTTKTNALSLAATLDKYNNGNVC